jgi:oxaloacetate decarboxylase gamma subunit
MSVGDQLLAGLELTVTGMVTVFVLLAFMVLVIGAMSRLALRLQPPDEPRTPSGPAAGHDPNLVSAIVAAVHRYRRDHRRER